LASVIHAQPHSSFNPVSIFSVDCILNLTDRRSFSLRLHRCSNPNAEVVMRVIVMMLNIVSPENAQLIRDT